MVIQFYWLIPITTLITTMKMPSLLPKLVKQGFDRYYKITVIDKVTYCQHHVENIRILYYFG